MMKKVFGFYFCFGAFLWAIGFTHAFWWLTAGMVFNLGYVLSVLVRCELEEDAPSFSGFIEKIREF